MSEDSTKNLTTGDLLRLILSRLDSVERRLDSMDQRIAALEAKSCDTKPIWEQALAGIMELRQEAVVVNQRLQRLEAEVALMGQRLAGIESRLDKMEKNYRWLGNKVDLFNQELIEQRDVYRHFEERLTELEKPRA
ncbi:MAG: hypothetical protein U0Z53_09470 [Blastocatellia bacterium]